MRRPETGMSRESALRSEKDEIRKLIKYFHPDAFQTGTPEDKERAAQIAQSLSAMLELNDRKRLVAENGWPPGTRAPTMIPLIAYVDGKRVAVDYRYQTGAMPREYLDIVSTFHGDPVAYLERVQARNRAAKAREDAEKERQEQARKQREIAEAAAKESENIAEAEHARLLEVINNDFGIRYAYGSAQAESDRKYGNTAVRRVQDLKRIIKIFEQVGSPMSQVRGLNLAMTRFDQSRVDGVMLWINMDQQPEQAVHSLLKSVQERALRNEVRDALAEKKPFTFSLGQFDKVPPEKTLDYLKRVRHALTQAEHGWIINSKLVHRAEIELSQIDAAQVRYIISHTDATKATGVRFEIGINTSTPVIAGLFDTAGKEIEKRYPSSTLAPHKAPLIGQYLESKYGIRFGSMPNNSKLVMPADRLEFLERLQEALDSLKPEERQWLRNMTVTTPNEGMRLFGRPIGSRGVSIHRNTFIAPADASKEAILAALRAEVKKKMKA